MQNRVRTLLTWILGGAFTLVVVPVIGAWFVEVAQQKSLYVDAGETWDSILLGARSWVLSSWVLFPFVGLSGLVIGLWFEPIKSLLVSGAPKAPYNPDYVAAMAEETVDLLVDAFEKISFLKRVINIYP